MRAAHTQSLIGSVRSLNLAERAPVMDAVGPARVAEIDGATPLLWLPMELHMRLSDALRDTVGAERNRRIWRSTMDASYDRPILHGFVSAAVDLFGVTPASLFRQTSRIYSHLTQGLGDLAFEATGSTSGRVILRGFPASDYRFICYVEGLAGCLESTISVTRAIGEVTPTDVDDTRGDVAYVVRWEARTSARERRRSA